MRIQALVLALASLLVMGCDGSVTNFVRGEMPSKIRRYQSTAPDGMKVSPGHMDASATGGAIQATVTPTNQVLKASDKAISLSISRTRMNPSN